MPTTACCTFRVDDLCLSVPVSLVQEILRAQPLTRVPLAPPDVSGLINLRGQIVPAVDMRRRLGRPSRSPDDEPTNIVLRTDDGAIALLVDAIGDVVEIDERQHDAPPPTLRAPVRRLVHTVARLDDDLLLMLDTGATLDLRI
jgi:purine-binding chemotaxis protein CheW